jgi:hypothetical protein
VTCLRRRLRSPIQTALRRITYEWRYRQDLEFYARFDVFTVVTMKNAVFWNLVPYGSC